MQAPVQTGRVRFGAFEVDLRSGELRKHGLRVKLQVQPFQILALLLERPGEVVTREELRGRLWPADTFVDFDVGLNTAIKRLRDALCDTAESPRYIETVPKRGYRFIATVESPAPPAHLIPVHSVLAEGGSPRTTILDAAKPSCRPGWAATETRFQLRWALPAILVLIAAIAGLTSKGFRQRPFGRIAQPKTYSIAVLPFKNLSSEPDSEYFTDGLTGEIIRNLSIIEGLDVKSQTSSFFFKDKPQNVHDVGAQLGVGLVLEGSVLRSGEKLRITAELIRVSDDAALWSGRFERKLEDVFTIQDEISHAIVNELRLKLGSGQRRYNTNLEAYDAYLKANALAVLHGERLPESIGLFERVIEKDSDYAPAYAGLSIAYADATVTPNWMLPDLAYPKMRAAAEKALQLDPLLPEAHAGMGLVYSRDHSWREAEAEFRRSIELNRGISRSHVDFALWVLVPTGRVDEALQELRTAQKIDPLSTSVQSALIWVLISHGRYKEPLETCRTIPNDYSDPHVLHMRQDCGRGLMQQGRIEEAISIFEEHGAKGAPVFLGYAYAKSGRRGEAEQLAGKYQGRPSQIALIYAGLGDRDRTIEYLQKMADQHDPRIHIYLQYPEFDLLQGDPRFSALREKVRRPLTP